MIGYLRRPAVITSIIGALIVGGGGYYYFNHQKGPTYNFVPVENHSVKQIMSVTGTVKPAEAVDLAFERSGKIASVSGDVGTKVTVGQTIVSLDHADFSAEVSQAQANVMAAKAELQELKAGTRQEQIDLAQTQVDNARAALDDANRAYNNTQDKGAADLKSVYDSAITTAQSMGGMGQNALFTIANIQEAHFTGDDTDSTNLANAKATAVKNLLGGDNGEHATIATLSTFHDGAVGEVKDALDNFTPEHVDVALSDMGKALQDIKNTLDTIPLTDDITTDERTSIATAKSSISSAISSIAEKRRLDASQRATNSVALEQAQAVVTRADNDLYQAEANLNVQRAGSSDNQIAAQEARVAAALANVQSATALVAKSIILAPISGTITKQDAKVGAIAPAGIAIVTLISNSTFEIGANVPEADISKIAVGNKATVTLDALGGDVVLDASVVKIDPAETIIDGVASYKVTLQFVKNDDRIKSGMTANVDVITATKDNVVSVHEHSLQQKDGKTVVLVKTGDTTTEDRPVVVGLRGADGFVEITSGLTTGEQIVVFP